MFRSAAARIRFRPSDGLEVVAGGRVRLYAARGTLQLYVESLEPRGLGALRLRSSSCATSSPPRGCSRRSASDRCRPAACVGIVTALGGAAMHDMLTMLRLACRISA